MLTDRQIEVALAETAAPSVPARTTVDCIGIALDLEARAKIVESQTTERAMLAAAHALRLLHAEPPAAPSVKWLLSQCGEYQQRAHEAEREVLQLRGLAEKPK